MTEEKNQPMEELGGQPCPMCNKPSLTLREERREIPFFGPVYLFSMTCSNCKYHKSDVEAEQHDEPRKFTIEISGEEDMKIRVVKSGEATVKIPRMVTVESGPASNGYISNVEGVLNRIKSILESQRDNEDDDAVRKKAKAHLKKLTRVMWGQDKLTLIIEDKSGNSAIVSDKAKISKL